MAMIPSDILNELRCKTRGLGWRCGHLATGEDGLCDFCRIREPSLCGECPSEADTKSPTGPPGVEQA